MLATAPTPAAAPAPWVGHSRAWERACTSGVAIDLERGWARIAGSELRLHALAEEGTLRLEDGSSLRLPGFDARCQCVASALHADDPPAVLLDALRQLMRGTGTSAPERTLVDALLLALAGAALDAPPFCRCTPPDGNGDAWAITVDLAAIERASGASAAGGWQRLQFAPLLLEDLIDEMLQRLLARGSMDEGLPSEAMEAPPQPAPIDAPVPRIRAWPHARAASVFRREEAAASDAPQRAAPKAMQAVARQLPAAFARARVSNEPLSPVAKADAPTPIAWTNVESPASAPVTTSHATLAMPRALRGFVPRHHVPPMLPAAPHEAPHAASTPQGADPRNIPFAQIQPPPTVARQAIAAPAPLQQEREPARFPAQAAPTPTPSDRAGTVPLPPDPLADIAWSLAGECDLRGLAP